MNSKIQLGKALCLFLVILMNFSVGGFVYGFQEFRSPVKIELVGSQAPNKRSTCYFFNRICSKNVKVIPISDWDNYLQYFESKMTFCQKKSIWIFENIPKIKIYAFKRCFDFDDDFLLSNAAQPWCTKTCIQQNSFINKKQYENFII